MNVDKRSRDLFHYTAVTCRSEALLQMQKAENSVVLIVLAPVNM